MPSQKMQQVSSSWYKRYDEAEPNPLLLLSGKNAPVPPPPPPSFYRAR